MGWIILRLGVKKVEQFETFKKACETINENRTNKGDLEIQEEER